MTAETCCASVWHSLGHGSFHTKCRNAAKVIRDGKGYCATHDPERLAAKRSTRNAAYAQKQAEKDALKQQGAALATRLGVGSPHYQWTPNFSQSGYTGGVVLTAEEAAALADRLEAVDGR